MNIFVFAELYSNIYKNGESLINKSIYIPIYEPIFQTSKPSILQQRNLSGIAVIETKFGL